MLSGKCPKCKGRIKCYDDRYLTELVTVETEYEPGFSHSTGVKKYVCIECGYMESYAKNPKVWTESSYRHKPVR